MNHTQTGTITVRCTTFDEPEGLRGPSQTAVEIVVSDTGCGMSPAKVESIYKEFEQAESVQPETRAATGVGELCGHLLSSLRSNDMVIEPGLGLAVVSRIVQQLGGQLRVESKEEEGSQLSFLIPLTKSADGSRVIQPKSSAGSLPLKTRTAGGSPEAAEIDSLCEVLSSMSRPTSTKSKE